MTLLTAELRAQLVRNGRRQAAVKGTPDEIDFRPVVKLFTPDAGATWLLTELDADGDTLFGLCDLGMGCPELGSVSLAEIASVRGRLGLPVERDLYWTASGPLSAYAAAADKAGCIVDLPHRDGNAA
jgi:hypothetical protein